MPTITAPPHIPKTVDITVTMNQAFAMADIISMLDKNSYEYKQLTEVGQELHKKAKKLHK
jgi:hypothetical protein